MTRRVKIVGLAVLGVVALLVLYQKWANREFARSQHADIRVSAAARGDAVLCVAEELVDRYGWSNPRGEMVAFRELLDGFALAHHSFDVEFRVNVDSWRRFQAAKAAGQAVRPEDVIQVVSADQPCGPRDVKHSVKLGKVSPGWDNRD